MKRFTLKKVAPTFLPVFVAVWALYILTFFMRININKFLLIGSLIVLTLIELYALGEVIFSKLPERKVKVKVKRPKKNLNWKPFKNIFKSHYLYLAITYILLAVNMILAEKEIYSIEWAFVPFVVAAIVFGILKIDSRYLILLAILGLAYCPFLLIAKLESFAENIAIYVYYLLLTGVILQIVQKTVKLDFTKPMMNLIKSQFFLIPSILLIITTITLFIFNLLSNLKFTFLYLAVVSSIFYALKYILD